MPNPLSPAQIALRNRIDAAIERRDAAPNTDMRETIHAHVVELRAALAALDAEEAAKPPPALFVIRPGDLYDGFLSHPSMHVPNLKFSLAFSQPSEQAKELLNVKRILDALNSAIAGRTLVLE